MQKSDPHKPRDGIYLTILWILVADVLIGAVLALVGDYVLEDPAISRLGVAMALIGGALYAVFRWLGARERARRRAAARRPGRDDGPS